MAIQWIGPGGGLGNRILGLAAALALSRSLHSTIAFPWHALPVCPAEFHDLFEDMPGIQIDNSIQPGMEVVGENPWEPFVICREFEKQLRHAISLEEYFLNFLEAIRTLKYRKSLLGELDSYRSLTGSAGFIAFHIRRTDRVAFHKNSLRRLLSVKRFKKSLAAIYNAGFGKTLQYTLFSADRIRAMENVHLAKMCRNLLADDNALHYSIYADSYDETAVFLQELRRLGIPREYYTPSYCNMEGQSEVWGKFGRRNTSVQSALIELLAMSASKGILQNISASSFSICSSIIGKTPILTVQPRHLFWREIEKILGKPPCDITTGCDNMSLSGRQYNTAAVPE